MITRYKKSGFSKKRLVNIYAKHGRIHKAWELFNNMCDANSFMVYNNWRIHIKWIF